ncbi:Transthyretin-like family protein [Dictyocaulus viviparus]|uniref:Transthyretin-like family protein n=1 Tax=Dictyocaulus viviparus TaxID=29172 RepID=A0A0D8XS71_DICVI|nr:Transthyretin-like family protein [Dictyocaulus viviparus]
MEQLLYSSAVYPRKLINGLHFLIPDDKSFLCMPAEFHTDDPIDNLLAEMKVAFTCAALSITVTICCNAFRTQSVAVQGKLVCGNHPAANVHVKLLDEDHGDPDDVLDYVLTKSDGIFNLSGSASELTPIDPELRIYHDCNDYGKPCQRQWIIRIPSKYIYSGIEPDEAMNLGIMNLEASRSILSNWRVKIKIASTKA